MKRTASITLVAALTAGALCGPGISQEPGRGPAAPADRLGDERAIREAIDGFTRAFARGDAKALAGSFTEDGEAIDAEGRAIQGRAALEEHYAGRLAGSPGDRLDVGVQSISLLAPGVARVAGRTRVLASDGSTAAEGRFASIHIKRDGRWLLASVREVPEKEQTPHEHLEELAWLVGDWVEESPDAVVATSIAWSDGGNYLVRSFDVKVQGKPALSGTQRIGWDPLTRQIKSWVFTSDGGHGEGLWTRRGDQWVIKARGVRPDGRVTTATQVLTFVNRDAMRWKSIDRTLGVEISPDIDEIVMVRKPPQPSAK